MDAQHAVGLGVGQDLHEAVGLAVGAAPRIGHERELARLVGDAVLFELLLGLADRRGFGPGIDDAGNGVVIDMGRLAGHRLDGGDALFLGLVGQHGAVDDVADGIDARHVGLEAGVGLDPAALVDLDAGLLEPKAVGVRHPADGHQDGVAFDLFLIAALRRRDGQGDAAVRRLGRQHLGA